MGGGVFCRQGSGGRYSISYIDTIRHSTYRYSIVYMLNCVSNSLLLTISVQCNSCLPLLHLMTGAGMKTNLQLIHFLLVGEEEAVHARERRNKN